MYNEAQCHGYRHGVLHDLTFVRFDCNAINIRVFDWPVFEHPCFNILLVWPSYFMCCQGDAKRENGQKASFGG
jgi:hypothetical protein